MIHLLQGRRGNTVLRTPRLDLVPITRTMLDAERRADGTLGGQLHARVTAEWPPEHWEPHVLDFIAQQILTTPHAADWHRYVLLREMPLRRVLVGCVGGFPKANGDVEIGYSTLPAYQRRGYATEAAGALVEMLLARETVYSVSAQTYETLPESVKVMERVGMSFVGPGDHPGTVRYRRMRG